MLSRLGCCHLSPPLRLVYARSSAVHHIARRHQTTSAAGATAAHSHSWNSSHLTSNISSIMADSSSLYSTAVSKLPNPSSIPEEATSKPHHVRKGSKTTGFKNPYPSYSNPVNLTNILKRIVWYVFHSVHLRQSFNPLAHHS